ncbi:MAG: FtsQ-type POTRA domain-containing protein [Chlorobiaceae bacterium]|nr:FtsQ-type POTRA domain-containing protein [Chlorobiaceae bacterium]
MTRSNHNKGRTGLQQEPVLEFSPDPPLTGKGSPKGKARRILGSTPVITTLVVLLLGAIAALSWYAEKWKKGVMVNRVVVSGTSLVPAQEIERRLQVFKGRTLDDVRLEEIRRALGQQPYIRQMQTSRELNGILRLRIQERRPAAVAVNGESRLIIDTEGVLLPDNGISGRFHRLTPVYGISANSYGVNGTSRLKVDEQKLLVDILAAFAESSHAGLMLSEIHLSPANQSWFSVSGSPIRFIIGNDGNFKEKLKKFEIFWQKVVAKKGIDCYESVDLRFQDRVFAREVVIPVTPAAPSAQGAMPTGNQTPVEHH